MEMSSHRYVNLGNSDGIYFRFIIFLFFLGNMENVQEPRSNNTVHVRPYWGRISL